MVMMHELAHNKHMNHSKLFHSVRIEFTHEMKALWERGYTGDGIWGRGVLLENGAFAHTELGDGEILPENLCGGTFKSRGGRKRKSKPKVTYAEKQERRIKKRFGTNGVVLGADEETKAKLDKGNKPAGKPRVAGSARGRELRAAAALARFEIPKEEPPIKEEGLVTDSETESDVDGEISIKTESEDAVDIDGTRLLDTNGQPLVKVCEDEDGDVSDENTKNELLEFQSFHGRAQHSQPSRGPLKSQTKSVESSKPTQVSTQSSKVSTQMQWVSAGSSKRKPEPVGEDIGKDMEVSCPVCSMENEATALTCTACSNVLKADFVPDWWRCRSSTCKDGDYINAGDVGLCGVCGSRKIP